MINNTYLYIQSAFPYHVWTYDSHKCECDAWYTKVFFGELYESFMTYFWCWRHIWNIWLAYHPLCIQFSNFSEKTVHFDLV